MMKQNDGYTISWQPGIAEVAENGIFFRLGSVVKY